MPDIIAGAKRTTRRPQTTANRVLPLPDPFRQSLMDDGHLALRRGVGLLEAAAGDDRDAHRPEIVAHDELVVVDDFKGPAIVGGVVLDRRSDRIWSSIRRQTRDRKSTRLNSSHVARSYAVFCLKKKTNDGGLGVVRLRDRPRSVG